LDALLLGPMAKMAIAYHVHRLVGALACLIDTRETVDVKRLLRTRR